MARSTLILTLFLILVMSPASFGLSGIGIGARAGVVGNYDNPDLVFEQAKDIDVNNLAMFGGHIRISSLPVFTYELAAEYSWRQEDYTVLGKGISLKVRDFMVSANVKYLIEIPVLTPYFGGGIATHQMTYEFDPPLGSIVGDVGLVIPSGGPKFGIHGLAGVAFGLPTSPIELFVEGRIGKITGDEESTNYSAVYGGVTLKFP